MSTVSELMTVSEAAEFAGVTSRSIYYHISNSGKLFPVHQGTTIKIQKSNLMELYPARNPGVKQKVRDTRATRESVIGQVADLIAQQVVNGNMTEATNLLNLAKFI